MREKTSMDQDLQALQERAAQVLKAFHSEDFESLDVFEKFSHSYASFIEALSEENLKEASFDQKAFEALLLQVEVLEKEATPFIDNIKKKQEEQRRYHQAKTAYRSKKAFKVEQI